MPLTLAALLFVLRPGSVQGPALEDGVRALLGGDARAAAAMLRPLTQGDRADPAAQFLLAALSMSDRAGSFNLGLACGLFTETAKSTHVLAQPAMEIADAMREEMGAGAMMVCNPRLSPESIPATFTLGLGHTVDILGSSIVVKFGGAQTVVRGGPGPGMVPLPTRYTPVDVTRPVAARRHFLQSFVWWPDNPDQPSAWNLGWTLSEVVGAGYFPVTGDPRLVTVPGARPPASYYVERLVRLFVNADGEVEWNTGGADNLRRGIVPWRERR
jgi:hypothetical protein